MKFGRAPTTHTRWRLAKTTSQCPCVVFRDSGLVPSRRIHPFYPAVSPPSIHVTHLVLRSMRILQLIGPVVLRVFLSLDNDSDHHS
jgi:hypothetical protein